MKQILPVPLSFWIALILGVFSLADLSAQEEDLNRALADQKRRTAGLASLTNSLKNLVYKYLPGGNAESVPEKKESATTAPIAVATMGQVRLRDSQTETTPSEATITPEQQAELEEQAYLESLQAAASKLNITGSFPKTKQIMVGAQNLGIGDEIAIKYLDHLYNLEILDINTSELKLKDQKSMKELNVSIGVKRALPTGMFRNPPPGMLPAMAPPGTPMPSGPVTAPQSAEAK